MSARLISALLLAIFYPIGLIVGLATGSIRNIVTFLEILVPLVFIPVIVAIPLYAINRLTGNYYFDSFGLAVYIAMPINFAIFYFVTFRGHKSGYHKKIPNLF